MRLSHVFPTVFFLRTWLVIYLSSVPTTSQPLARSLMIEAVIVADTISCHGSFLPLHTNDTHTLWTSIGLISQLDKLPINPRFFLLSADIPFA